MKRYLIVLTLMACGKEQVAATDAQKDTSKSVATDTKTDTSTEVSESKPETSSIPAHKTPTKDETLMLLSRLSFDQAVKKGNMFEVSDLYYVMKGATGTMGYPDRQYVPQDGDIRASCPAGFSIASRIALSISAGHGLLSALPTDKTWIWTSDRPSDNPTGYYAYAAKDWSGDNNFNYVEGMFYQIHQARFDAQVYCVMDVHALPKIEDLPPYLQEALKAMAGE